MANRELSGALIDVSNHSARRITDDNNHHDHRSLF